MLAASALGEYDPASVGEEYAGLNMTRLELEPESAENQMAEHIKNKGCLPLQKCGLVGLRYGSIINPPSLGMVGSAPDGTAGGTVASSISSSFTLAYHPQRYMKAEIIAIKTNAPPAQIPAMSPIESWPPEGPPVVASVLLRKLAFRRTFKVPQSELALKPGSQW